MQAAHFLFSWTHSQCPCFTHLHFQPCHVHIIPESCYSLSLETCACHLPGTMCKGADAGGRKIKLSHGTMCLPPYLIRSTGQLVRGSRLNAPPVCRWRPGAQRGTARPGCSSPRSTHPLPLLPLELLLEIWLRHIYRGENAWPDLDLDRGGWDQTARDSTTSREHPSAMHPLANLRIYTKIIP